ncbi:MAG: hypothetical protein KGM47_18730 [Acidobacteriota bacterium]|nr:hypothetical protein [Acidobacteriota bacterium]
MTPAHDSRKKSSRRAPEEGRRDGFEGATSLTVIYGEQEIKRRVAQLAARINRDYRGRTIDLAALVDNSLVFVADLMRQVTTPVVCHLLHVTKKDSTWKGLPLREITFSPKPPLAGKHVLLVDGVVETGITLDFMIHSIQDQEPASLRTAALIVKTSAMKVAVTPDYSGFRCSGKYLVGYGMSAGGKFMNLPHIAEFHQQGYR